MRPEGDLAGDRRRAVALALAGDWDGAHRAVQPHEDDPMACWIHAVLHRIEGDQGNAAWWYRRAGRVPGRGEPRDELGLIPV